MKDHTFDRWQHEVTGAREATVSVDQILCMGPEGSKSGTARGASSHKHLKDQGWE